MSTAGAEILLLVCAFVFGALAGIHVGQRARKP